MEIVINGHDLPGRTFRVAGVPVHNVHVAVQVRDEPVGATPADAGTATWRVDVRVEVDVHGAYDFRGPAVHGRRGERFLYLTWGDVSPTGGFAMFRRAKLTLGDIEAGVVAGALGGGHPLVADIHLTDGYGGPRCARVQPPALRWSVSAD